MHGLGSSGSSVEERRGVVVGIIAASPRGWTIALALVSTALLAGCSDRAVTSSASVEGGADEGTPTASNSATVGGEGTSGVATTGSASTGSGAECVMGAIVPGCPCVREEDCGPGFYCNSLVLACVSHACPNGLEGCPCTPGGACDPRLECSMGFCWEPGCPTGSLGCGCIPPDVCNDGSMCIAERCR